MPAGGKRWCATALLLLQFISLVVESLPRQKRVAACQPERLKKVVPVERKWLPDPTLRPGIKLVPVIPQQIFQEISPIGCDQGLARIPDRLGNTVGQLTSVFRLLNDTVEGLDRLKVGNATGLGQPPEFLPVCEDVQGGGDHFLSCLFVELAYRLSQILADELAMRVKRVGKLAGCGILVCFAMAEDLLEQFIPIHLLPLQPGNVGQQLDTNGVSRKGYGQP